MKKLISKFQNWQVNRSKYKLERNIEKAQERIAQIQSQIESAEMLMKTGNSIPMYFVDDWKEQKSELAVLQVRLKNLQKGVE